MKFGVRLPNSGPLASPDNIATVAESADRLGFDSVWVHDHILWRAKEHQSHLSSGSTEALRNSQRPDFYESITTLAYLAGRTRRVKLGVAVIVLPLRNPIVLAKQLANVAVLSGNRLMVGVAPGAQKITEPEFSALGIPYEERGKITDEYILVMKRIWNEDLPKFEGKYAKFDEIEMFPKPHDLKILVGGGERGISSRALRRVVELGDGWIPAYLTPQEILAGIGMIQAAAIAKGRSLGEFTYAHEMFVTIGKDMEAAKRQAANTLSTNFTNEDEALKRSLVGDADEICKRIIEYSNAGVHMTELKFVYQDIPNLLGMMELFAHEVIPVINDESKTL